MDEVCGKRPYCNDAVPFGVRTCAFAAILSALMISAMGQTPVLSTYGYGRATLPGIPDSTGREGQGEFSGRAVLPTSYYLYLEIRKGARVAANWAWVRGRYYQCTLKKTDTPVVVGKDPVVPTQESETLVPRTDNDVYIVALGAPKAPAASNGGEGEPLIGNEAAISLTIDETVVYATIKSIRMLRPAAAM